MEEDPTFGEKLVARHPHLKLPSYIECGDGWFDLLDTLCGIMPPGLIVGQIKQKFGGLRYYTDNATDFAPSMQSEIHGAIRLAETLSFRVCEVCGGPAKSKGGQTLCPEHTK